VNLSIVPTTVVETEFAIKAPEFAHVIPGSMEIIAAFWDVLTTVQDTEFVIFYQESVSVIQDGLDSIVWNKFVPITVQITEFVIKPPIHVFVTSGTEESIVAKAVQASVVYTGIIYSFIIYNKNQIKLNRLCDFDTLQCTCRLGFGLSDCSGSCLDFCSGHGKIISNFR
jgi:hypothetical protein